MQVFVIAFTFHAHSYRLLLLMVGFLWFLWILHLEYVNYRLVEVCGCPAQEISSLSAMGLGADTLAVFLYMFCANETFGSS